MIFKKKPSVPRASLPATTHQVGITIKADAAAAAVDLTQNLEFNRKLVLLSLSLFYVENVVFWIGVIFAMICFL